MGRYTTGYISTGQAMRIELNYLFKKGYIKKNCHISGSLSWNNGNSINIETIYTNEEKYILLKYTNTSWEGEKKHIETKIQLFAIPSNLGKGEVLYFICPQSGRLCRILYKCYGSLIFKCRRAYSIRIYYSTQMQSKHFYYNEKYFQVEKMLNKLESERRSYYYKGKPTKRLNKIIKLQQDLESLDSIRFNFLQNFL